MVYTHTPKPSIHHHRHHHHHHRRFLPFLPPIIPPPKALPPPTKNNNSPHPNFHNFPTTHHHSGPPLLPTMQPTWKNRSKSKIHKSDANKSKKKKPFDPRISLDGRIIKANLHGIRKGSPGETTETGRDEDGKGNGADEQKKGQDRIAPESMA